MTALTVYGINTAATTITTADQLVSVVSGTTNTNKQSKCGTSTGFSEVYSQGTTNAWAGAGSLGSASGHGYLWDVTTLEGQTLAAGNYTPLLRLNITVGTATADLYVRLYKYNGGTYTSIGNCLLSGQSLTTTATAYTFSATSLAAMAFSTGDKLYWDVWLNITANSSGSSTANIAMSLSNNGTNGSSNAANIVTPGYSPTPISLIPVASDVEMGSSGTLTESLLGTAADIRMGSTGALTQNAHLTGTAADLEMGSTGALTQNIMLVGTAADLRMGSAGQTQLTPISLLPTPARIEANGYGRAAVWQPVSPKGIFTGIGPYAVQNIQDYTRQIDFKRLEANAQQGTQNDTLKATLWDALAQATIAPEDDIVLLDASDPAGFPTVNMLFNPSMEGTYSGVGLAGFWGFFPSLPLTGVTASAGTTNLKYGSKAQQLVFNNVAASTQMFFSQQVVLPVDENNASIIKYPFSFSVWLNPYVPLVNITSTVHIDWYTAGGSYINSSNRVPMATTTPGWQRYVTTGYAPSNATNCQVVVQFNSVTSTYSTVNYMRGINDNGGEFGANPGQLPGVYNTDYHYDSAATFTYLAGRGHKLIRLPFRWERVQPTLGAALNATEVNRLLATLANINAAGMQCVLDMHNFAQYVDNSGTTHVLGATLNPASLVDVWVKLSNYFNNQAGLYAYGIMGEPFGMPAINPVFTASATLATFDSGVQSWVIQSGTGGSVAQSTTTYYQGTGSLACTKSFAATGFDSIRPEDNNTNSGVTMGSNPTLSCWVYIPLSAPSGLNWQGFIWMNDSSNTQHAGSSFSVIPGIWTQLLFTPTSGVWSGHKDIGVQVGASNINATVTIYVDWVQQGVATGGTAAAQVWEGISQQVLTAIRNNGDNTKIMIAGYNYSNATTWTTYHTNPWITDPANNFSYEAHHYFDNDNSGNYASTYATENSNAVTQGYASLTARATTQLNVFVNWLTAHSVKGFIGEIGWRNDESTASWNSVGDACYTILDTNHIDACYWAAGEWWFTSYKLTAYDATTGGAVNNAQSPSTVLETTAHLTSITTVTNSNNSGTVLVDGAQFENWVFQACYVDPIQNLTAAQAGLYPTPFVDPAMLGNGIYLDAISGFYYRQLRIFGGFIKNIHNDFDMGPERLAEITAVDYGVKFSEAPATLVILHQQDSSAIAAAVTYARNADSRLLEAIDTTTFVMSIAMIDGFIVNWNTTKDVMDHISAQTIASWWVDQYKRLHYTPALAISAPFGVSDNPDMVNTFPFSHLTYDSDSTQTLTTEVIEGSTQLSSEQTQSFNGDGVTTVFTVNSGNPIAQVDRATVGGAGQTIGLANYNTFAAGYAALYDPNQATLTFNTAPAAGTNNVVVIFRINAPVLIRVRNTAAAAPTGAVRRPIHTYQKIDTITSQQSAIDRANADLSQNSKAKPIGTLSIRSDQCPIVNQLRPGMAIQVTHAGAKFAKTLFQIQSIRTTVIGPGLIQRDLGIGFYRPDFIIQAAQSRAAQLRNDTQVTAGTVLNDIQSAGPDGWTLADHAAASVSNIGSWANPATSTWGGMLVWG